MSKEAINYNLLSLILADCDNSKLYKVLNLDSDTVTLERDNEVDYPFFFSDLEERISYGGNKGLSEYIESRFEELLNLPY